MKEKNIKIIFFTIIIIIIVFSIYYIIKNKNTLAKDTEIKKQENYIDSNIIIGITNLDTLNPILSKNQDIQYISKLIYEPLIDISEDFRLKESLAIQWAQIDNKTYLLTLNENKTWHDEKAFTAKDVEYTINYIKNNNSIFLDNVKNIENIEIVNNYTIKINLLEEEENFEYMLCFPIICERENIGTGKYKIGSINQNEINLIKTYEKQEIKIKIFDSLSNLYGAFNNGKVDIITTKNKNYEKYIGEIGYNKIIHYGRNFDYLKFNTQSSVFSNIEVIKAVGYLINKNEIINKEYNNTYLKAEFPLQYGSYLYNNNIEYEYNINKAQKILEDSGWKYNRNFLAKKRTSIKNKTSNQ